MSNIEVGAVDTLETLKPIMKELLLNSINDAEFDRYLEIYGTLCQVIGAERQKAKVSEEFKVNWEKIATPISPLVWKENPADKLPFIKWAKDTSETGPISELLPKSTCSESWCQGELTFDSEQ